MAIRGYLVMSKENAVATLGRRLSEIPGCEVIRAENRDVLLLVTETEDVHEEEALQEALGRLEEIRAMILVFGEIGSPPPEPIAGVERLDA